MAITQNENQPPTNNKSGSFAVILVLILFSMITITLIKMGIHRPRCVDYMSTLMQCQSNEKNLGISLEFYADDHNHQYPSHLKDVLSYHCSKTIPICPQAGKDTYSPGYQVSADARTFTLCCKGHNHECNTMRADLFDMIPYKKRWKENLPADYPRYSSKKGLVLKP